MENTKIIQFLKCLSRHELNEFGKFVRSPFHNKRKEVIRFFDTLRKGYPEFHNLSKEKLFKLLFPDKKYNAETIVLLSAYLFNLGRDFLAITDFKEDKFFYKYHYLNSLDKHNADSLFVKANREAEGLFNGEKLNKDSFGRKCMMVELLSNFDLKRNRQDRTCKKTIEYGDYMIYSFIVNMAIIYHGMLVNKTSFNYEYTDSTAYKFLRHVELKEFIDNLNIENKLYSDFVLYHYYLLMCFYNPGNDDYYLKLKQYSFMDFESIDLHEKTSRLLFLIDYCLQRVKLGDLKYLKESFRLHNEVLENKLHNIDSSGNEIGAMFFRNFVIIGLAAGELDSVEKFIDEHGNEINADIREDLLELSYAMLYSERKDYDKALQCLSKVSNAFPLFRMATKYHLLKIYYETERYDSFFSLADSYRHYLKNEKILTELIKGYHTNFLNYVMRLAKIKESGIREDLFILKKEITENMNMDFRHRIWLMEKARELEGNN